MHVYLWPTSVHDDANDTNTVRGENELKRKKEERMNWNRYAHTNAIWNAMREWNRQV